MSEIAKSDIFFFITSISVVVLSILLAMLLVYAFRIIKDLRVLVSKVKEEGEEIVKDVKHTRLSLKEKGSNFSSFLSGIFNKKSRKKKSEE